APPARSSLSLHDALPISYPDASAFAAWVEKAAGQPDPLFFHLARRDGAPVGIAALLRIQPEVGVIEIGSITLAPDAQRSRAATRSEEHTSELQSRENLVC